MGRQVIVSGKSLRNRRLLQAGLAALSILAALAMYDFGLYQAGFERAAAAQKESELQSVIDELVSENKRQSAQLAILETAAKIDKESYRQVDSELGQLQSHILEQQEDIEFYKGIVNVNDGSGLRIQDFQIVQGLGKREFNLRLVLAQAFRSTRQVSGQVEVVVEGKRAGRAARLELSSLLADEQQNSRVSYSFRYFQDIKADIVIPADFIPERVHVIVHPNGKTSKTVEEFFIWDVKQG